jgi:hypothetical protein
VGIGSAFLSLIMKQRGFGRISSGSSHQPPRRFYASIFNDQTTPPRYTLLYNAHVDSLSYGSHFAKRPLLHQVFASTSKRCRKSKDQAYRPRKSSWSCQTHERLALSVRHWLDVRVWHSVKFVESELVIRSNIDVSTFVLSAIAVFRRGENCKISVYSSGSLEGLVADQ